MKRSAAGAVGLFAAWELGARSRAPGCRSQSPGLCRVEPPKLRAPGWRPLIVVRLAARAAKLLWNQCNEDVTHSIEASFYERRIIVGDKGNETAVGGNVRTCVIARIRPRCAQHRGGQPH